MKQEFVRIRATVRKPQRTWWTMALWSPRKGGPCWPRAEAEASGQDQASCAGARDLHDCGPPVPASWCLLSLRSGFLGNRDSPPSRQQGSHRGRDCQQPGFQPFPLSQKWLCFKKCPCRGGAGLALVGALLLCKNAWERRGRGSENQSPGAPLNDCFSKAPHLRPAWGSKFLSQPWIVGRGRWTHPVQDSCCPEFRGCSESKGSASSLPWQEQGELTPHVSSALGDSASPCGVPKPSVSWPPLGLRVSSPVPPLPLTSVRVVPADELMEVRW